MIGGLIPKTTKSKREPPSTASAASVGFSSAPIRQPKAKTQPAPKIGGLIPTRDTAREDRVLTGANRFQVYRWRTSGSHQGYRTGMEADFVRMCQRRYHWAV